MRILFLGLFYDEEGLKTSYKEVRGGVHMAQHRLQTLLIQGFEELGVEVQAVHVMPGGSFPLMHKRLFIKDRRWGKNNLRIGFLNLPFVKKWTQERKAYREMKKALTGDSPPDAIICYDTHKPFLRAIKRIKKKFPQVKAMLIETEAVPGRGDIVDNAFKKIVGNQIVSLCKSMDCFCLLTKHMTVPMEVGDRPYVVCEGIADKNALATKQTDGRENIFLYTGTMHKCFNLDTLIESFAYLPEAQLWLCGSLQELGEAESLIKKLPNVTYFGFLPFEQVQEYRDKCSYLINPRRPTGTYTKYTFPSKTMEYLVSGKPTVGYLLEGLGEDYYPYINMVQGTDAKTLAEDLRKIMAQDYATLQVTAAQAREYMLQEKTATKQTKKIVELLRG